MNQANLIKKARLKKGLTQLDLSKHFGFTTSMFISNLELGKSPIPKRRIKAFAKYLDLKPQDIIEAMIKDAVRDLKRHLRELA